MSWGTGSALEQSCNPTLKMTNLGCVPFCLGTNLTPLAAIKNNTGLQRFFNCATLYRIEVEFLMNLNSNSVPTGHRIGRLSILGGFILALALAASSCGGGTENNTSSIVPPANVSNQNVEDTLKFDSRVQDFDTDGDKLIVNVNESWMKSPPGLQERSVDGWFSGWKTERAGGGGSVPKGVAVVVKYDTNEVARATAEHGIELLQKPPAKSSD